ncbi:hypothetical protein NP493_142g01024 [Ridgeia piscesae]|uniref:1-phosphatidylinositol-5-phosphate 4-kinase n=1 Tax=Ridgeia piscesae TaxID=27915 RepID=A0AAD9UG89_RIDPI|nr:hypothetical protein NP493_142g01024 [Ridgeia piscesae]
MSGAAKQKKKHLKTVSQKLRLFRAKDPCQSVFMWGINHSISELKHIPAPPMLMPDDFKSYSKTKVDNHLFNKENMPSHFKFKEYCPIVFRNLRERFSIDGDSYMMSLSKDAPIDWDASGRSGSSFQLSYDKRFVIKTICSEEIAEMHRILKTYHQHVVERHGKTLLPHYLGMYRITVNDQETYKVVMKNICSPKIPIHKKYDLKGSTVSRLASDKERAKDLPTYKDNDFLNDHVIIHIAPEAKRDILETLQGDVNFMLSLNLMDYSLLVGIHDKDRAEEEQTEAVNVDENGMDDEGDSDSPGGAARGANIPTPPDSPVCLNQPLFPVECDIAYDTFGVPAREDCEKKEIYFLGLIDILTHYGMKKRTAQAAKTVKHGAGAEISTVKPDQYARRFMEFIERAMD